MDPFVQNETEGFSFSILESSSSILVKSVGSVLRAEHHPSSLGFST
jgi:hypothetical protein